MKKLITGLVFALTLGVMAQQYKEVVLVSDAQPMPNMAGSTNRVFSHIIRSNGDAFHMVTFTNLNYTNFAGYIFTNRPVVVGVSNVWVVWRATSGPTNFPSTLTMEKSMDARVWTSLGTQTLTAGTNGVYTYSTAYYTPDAFGYVRLGNITNASAFEKFLTNDVRLYYKANN